MRKPLLLLLAVVLAGFSAEAVSASPDCQRWLADYKTALAQKTAAQHLLAARNRARQAARRKLAQLTLPSRPVHPPTRASSTRPHLSPLQMLKHFDLLCGDLPVENQVLDDRMSPEELISEVALGGPLDVPAIVDDGTLIAENILPSFPLTALPTSGVNPAPPVFGPVLGGGFAPAAPGSPSGPVRPGTPGAPPVVTPVAPISPVPEPGSVVLVLTGVAGALAAGVKRSLS